MQAGQRMGWGHLRTGPNHDKGKSCHGWAKRTAFVPSHAIKIAILTSISAEVWSFGDVT
jgi:hypothetical protein